MSICKALRKDHLGVQMALRHPLLDGKKMIGRGVFSMVFEGTRKNTVLKMTVDNIGYYAFNDYMCGVRHKHFPRVTDCHGEIGTVRLGKHEESIYLYEMERLQPLKVGSEARRLARSIANAAATASGQHFWRTSEDIRAMLTFGSMLQDKSLPRSIRNALQQLEEFCGRMPGGSVDLHMHNMMMRKNGDLVIIDPVANMQIWRNARDQLRQRGW